MGNVVGDEATSRRSVLDRVLRDNADRDPLRLARKLKVLAGSPFGFFRGSCQLFYAGLPRAAVLKSAPLAWVCGDLHIANFGSYKAANRLVYFDINDFDEGTLAPCTYDLLRLTSSLFVAARELKLSPAKARELNRAMLERYSDSLAAGRVKWLERDNAEGAIKTLLSALRLRSRRKFLSRRVIGQGDAQRLVVDGIKSVAATPEEIALVRTTLETYAAQWGASEFFRVRDVTRRIAGTASLGRERYAVLVRGRGGSKRGYLLDLKLAGPSTLQTLLRRTQPAWPSEADRVVVIERTMQAAPPAFLEVIQMARRSYVLRELQPSNDRLDLDALSANSADLKQTLDSLAEIVAWDELRAASRSGSAPPAELIEFGKDRRWHRGLLELAESSASVSHKQWVEFCRELKRHPAPSTKKGG
jgi:uncharacterized protein (DUF2252 family)